MKVVTSHSHKLFLAYNMESFKSFGSPGDLQLEISFHCANYIDDALVVVVVVTS